MAENMDDRALEEQMRGLLDDGRDMAEFGASDAACHLYPEADQGPLREAFCRGAGYDHVRLVSLNLRLEAAKGAVDMACLALSAASNVLYNLRQMHNFGRHDKSAQEAIHEADAARARLRRLVLATLSTPAEKPEAVETGEPVAWAVRKHSAGEWELWWGNAPSPDMWSEIIPLYASPVPNRDERREALEEAAKVADGVAAHYASCGPSEVYYGQKDAAEWIAEDIRALAAIPTAGDATNGQ